MKPGDVFTADIGGVCYRGACPLPIHLLSDQVLVKCLPDDERMTGQSRVIMPGNIDRGYLAVKTGIVVQCGVGDAAVLTERHGWVPCPDGRTRFTVQPGDRVLYHPRDWAEWEYEGQKYIVLHEDQHILGILDDNAVVFTENQSTKSKGIEFDGAARLTNFSKGAQ